LPPLEPRALSKKQVRSFKNVCDRLEHFHHLKGRRQKDKHRTKAHGRPWRDRAIVYVLLSTGLRREELVRLNLDQIEPCRPEALRPHDLRHTFAFHLAKVTNADGYELERRLGHRSQRYIARYTNPPETEAAQLIEGF
jgi:integrase